LFRCVLLLPQLEQVMLDEIRLVPLTEKVEIESPSLVRVMVTLEVAEVVEVTLKFT
jgi:hypothetical protein